MGEQYAGFGSRISVDKLTPTARPGNIGKKGSAQARTTRPRPPWDRLNVEHSFFTVKMNAAGDQRTQVEETLGQCFGRKFTVEATNSGSDESFHSCASTASRTGTRAGARAGAGAGRRSPPRVDEPFSVAVVSALILNGAHARGDEGGRKTPCSPRGPVRSRTDAAESRSAGSARQRQSNCHTFGPKCRRAAEDEEESVSGECGEPGRRRHKSRCHLTGPKCQRVAENVAQEECGESVVCGEPDPRRKSSCHLTSLKCQSLAEDVKESVNGELEVCEEPGRRWKSSCNLIGPKYQSVVEDVEGSVSEESGMFGEPGWRRKSSFHLTGPKCQRVAEDVEESVSGELDVFGEPGCPQKSSGHLSFPKCQKVADNVTEEVCGEVSRYRESACRPGSKPRETTEDIAESVDAGPCLLAHLPPGTGCSENASAVVKDVYALSQSQVDEDSSDSSPPEKTRRFSERRCGPGVRRVESVTSFSGGATTTNSRKRTDPDDRATEGPEIAPAARRDAVQSGAGRSPAFSESMVSTSRAEIGKRGVHDCGKVRRVESYHLEQSFVELLPETDSARLVELGSHDSCDIANSQLTRPFGNFSDGKEAMLEIRDLSDLTNIEEPETPRTLQKDEKKALGNSLKLDKNTKVSKNVTRIVIHPLAQQVMKEENDLVSTSRIVPVLGNARNAVGDGTEKALTLARPGIALGAELKKALELARSSLNNDSPHDRLITMDENTDVVYMREELAASKRRKRSSGMLVNALPVIREESSESLGSTASEESNASAHYCLEDGSGRPIRLFDKDGLPLTDACGRPLRDADGQTLVACDGRGVPMVDASSGVFDHVGRQALWPDFAPWGAPPASPTARLVDPSGRPLMLFDALGRPLTDVDGALLVDRTGCPLLTLNCGGSKL